MTRRAYPKRRHDRRLADAQRDERVKLDIDPDDALRILLGVTSEGPAEDPEEIPENED